MTLARPFRLTGNERRGVLRSGHGLTQAPLGQMAKRKRTTLGTIIDHDKAARLDRVKMLFFVRWLEKHWIVKFAADFYYKHFFR